jgi:hypothetical protein
VSSVGACYFITLIGLTGQWKIPDQPSYTSTPTNLLDPWRTWCSFPDNGHNGGCYGTSWSHWGGPYGILWYWANAGLTLNGLLNYTLVLFVINIVIQIRLGFSWLALPWAVNVLFSLLSWPQNTLVLMFVLVGFYRFYGLVLAPLFKLPFGAFYPAVWNIALNSHTGIRDPGNWFTYLWLAAMWFGAFCYLFRAKLFGPVKHLTGKVEKDKSEDESENQRGPD